MGEITIVVLSAIGVTWLIIGPISRYIVWPIRRWISAHDNKVKKAKEQADE